VIKRCGPRGLDQLSIIYAGKKPPELGKERVTKPGAGGGGEGQGRVLSLGGKSGLDYTGVSTV